MNPFYFALLVAGLSFVQWLFKHLAAQAERRRLQQAQQRSELEMLRTGRTTEESEQEAPMDANARRREELAELRRRAAARRGQPAQAESSPARQVPPTPSNSPPTGASPLEILLGLPPGTTSGGTVSPKRSRPGRPDRLRTSQEQRPGQIDRASQGDGDARRRRQAQKLRAERVAAELKRKQELFERQNQAARLAQAKQFEHQRALESKSSAARKAVAAADFVPRTPEQWRRAFVVSEVLGKPVSLR